MMKILKSVGKTVLTVTVLMSSALFGLFGCFGEKKAVTSVEAMSLTLRGMWGGTVYELSVSDGRTELVLYSEKYDGEKNYLAPERSATCEISDIVSLMNDCGVMRWNGFHGKHPKNVCDGIMFIFKASVNGGEAISANGSENFPKGYREFVNGLDGILEKGETESERAE